MYSSLPNKVEKQCISMAFIIRIYHDAESYERQIKQTIQDYDQQTKTLER